jgi:hypothetical protein
MKHLIFRRILLLILVSIFSANTVVCQEKSKKNDIVLLKGIVVAEDGEPLPGVVMTEKGTTNGTITDSEGKFQLKVSKGAKLKMTFVGMSEKIFEVIDSSTVRIKFSEGLIAFCCENHKPAHCATTMIEMQKLAKEHNCSFK